MNELLFFGCGALCVVIGNLLAIWKERARAQDQMLLMKALLTHNRTLQNRLSAKDISGYLMQEKFDQQTKNSENGQSVRQVFEPGYPQNIVGSG